jgi:hypothetical protein
MLNAPENLRNQRRQGGEQNPVTRAKCGSFNFGGHKIDVIWSSFSFSREIPIAVERNPKSQVPIPRQISIAKFQKLQNHGFHRATPQQPKI